MSDAVQARFDALFGPEFGHGKALGTDALRTALAKLGDPQNNLPPVIHVAGTNGKGSTIAFMRAMALAGGLRVHAFTKPHLNELSERFFITRQDPSNQLASLAEHIDEATLIACAERVASVDPNLTQFDAQVCAALLLFSEYPADLVFLEAGMGGRDDSTNVIGAPALAVITPIALDHVGELGPALEDIARHKAGIIKPGGKVITARQSPAAMEILEQRAAEVGAVLHECGRDWDSYERDGLLIVQTETRVEDFPPPNLVGRHQWDNAGLAAAGLMMLDLPKLDSGSFSGVMLAQHPARLQPLTRGLFSAPVRTTGGEVWVDGGHNAHGAAALREALHAMQKRRPAPVVAIIGMQARKQMDDFVGALADGVDRIIGVPLDAPHWAPEMIAACAQIVGVEGATASSLEAAMQNAAQLPAPRVLICGSFLLAAEALRLESG